MNNASTHRLLRRCCLSASLVLVSLVETWVGFAQDSAPCQGARAISTIDSWFLAEPWAKIGQPKCLMCHRAGGDAEDTRFVLRDPATSSPDEFDIVLRYNRDAFASVAKLQAEGESLLLVKVTGGLDHGGDEVLPPDSEGFRILQQFLSRINRAESIDDVASVEAQAPPYFEGVTMVDDRRLLRRATLSLAGRLPTEAELRSVSEGGPDALSDILDHVMREEAFYDRLREGFNDIFLTLGVDGNPDQTVLSYEHFEKTRGWYATYDLSRFTDENERRQAGYKLANDYRAALLDEPMRLVDYIVRNDRPFTEIVTADYIMVSPYTARGYGIFDDLKDQFQNSEDPFEYIPVRLKALIGRNPSEDQESESDYYPHAGLLSTFQYLSRYPTTETNRNRLRARMYYQHFLGVDVLELASRVSDAAAVTAKYANPTMQASECVVCHKSLDPVAGLFQDYWRFDANFSIYGRRKEGWFTDMFPAGFEGETLPPGDRWRALQWLGEKTAGDPRFAKTMAGHAYYLLTGRRPALAPKDLEDPLFAEKYRAWRQQQCQVESIAKRFSETGFQFKQLIRDWVLSEFYRADGLATAEYAPERLAELQEVGVVRLLSPEQLERKIEAVFGQRWGRLSEQTALLYGGIDSKEVTERATDPSGAMGAIQRTMANDVACRNVALDFSRPAERRLLFPGMEPDIIPGISPETDSKIRSAIVYLHRRILGREDSESSREVQRTFQLFAGIVADAANRGNTEPQEIWSCRQGLESPVPDPHYTVRAWRAVVTYLLRQPEFLYE